jgi:hypothetical protein
MPTRLQMALLILVIAGVPSCSSKPDYSRNSKYHSTRFPQTRTISEGKVWLDWTDSERLAFLRGLAIGYRQGNSDVCNEVAGLNATPADCQRADQLPPSGSALIIDDAVNAYSKSMTAFYENHAEDDDVPLTVLFKWLVFERKSPTEVHNLLPSRSL